MTAGTATEAIGPVFWIVDQAEPLRFALRDTFAGGTPFNNRPDFLEGIVVTAEGVDVTWHTAGFDGGDVDGVQLNRWQAQWYGARLSEAATLVDVCAALADLDGGTP